MSDLTIFGWTVLGVSIAIYWWRAVVPLAIASLVGWGISRLVSANTAWLSSARLVFGLTFGVMWQVKFSRGKKLAVAQRD